MTFRHPGDYDLGWHLGLRQFVRLLPDRYNRIPKSCVRITSLIKNGKRYPVKDIDGFLSMKHWSADRFYVVD